MQPLLINVCANILTTHLILKKNILSEKMENLIKLISKLKTQYLEVCLISDYMLHAVLVIC